MCALHIRPQDKHHYKSEENQLRHLILYFLERTRWKDVETAYRKIERCHYRRSGRDGSDTIPKYFTIASVMK